MTSADIHTTLHGALSHAQTLLDRKQTDDALSATAHLLATFPDAVRVWRVRAAALSNAGRPDEAAAAWMRVLDVTPDDDTALAACAAALRLSGRGMDAADLERQALDYTPADFDPDEAPTDGSGRILLARHQFAAGQVNQAVAQLRSILEAQPTRPDALATLVQMLWHSSIRHVTAELCRSLLAAHPNCLTAHALLAAYGERRGDVALQHIHGAAAAALDPDGRERAAILDAAAAIADVEFEEETAEEHAVVKEEEPALVEPSVVDRPSSVVEEEEAPRPAWVDDIVADAANRIASDDPEHVAPEHMPSLDWAADDEEPSDLGALASEPAAPASQRSTSPRIVTDEGIVVEPLDWSQIDDAGADVPLISPKPKAAADAPSKPRKMDKDARAARSGKGKQSDTLQSARTALIDGDVDHAANLYEGLITKGKLLDEIIDDLDAAAFSRPGAKRLHELLGQAHTRKGNIPAALEAYRKAMQ